MSLAASVVSAAILEGNLIIGLSDGSVINCGYVQGPPGLQGNPGPMGADGDAGRDGNTIITVAGAPRNDAGTDGDYAIDNVNWRIYGPKSGGVWGKANEMLPSKENLIVNGRGFEGGVGGGGESGGGGGTGGIVAITSGDGIDVGPTPTSPNITVSAAIKTSNGLKFEDNKIAINIGTGLSFDASTGALNADGGPSDLSEYAKITYVDDKTSDTPYRIETDKVTRAGKAVKSGEPEIQLVDNEDNYTNVKFTGSNGIAVTSDIQGIQFDGSALAVKTEVAATATDLQNQIDQLETQKGTAANYDCKSVTPGYNCRAGEIAFVDATASSVALLGLGLEDKSGNLTKTISVGDIIEIDTAGGVDTRYRATDVTGAPLLITVEFVSGEQTFAIDQQYTVYIYPQNEAGASKTYVDNQLALKADTATVNAELADKADRSELNQYVTTSTANSTYLRDGSTTNKLMINRTAGGSIDSMKVTNITGGATVWRLDAKAGSDGPIIYKTEGLGFHKFVGSVFLDRVGDNLGGFTIGGRKADGSIGNLLQTYHNGGSTPDAINYSGQINSGSNIVNKAYVDSALTTRIADLESRIATLNPSALKTVIEVGTFDSGQALVNRSNTPVLDLTQHAHGTATFATHIGNQPLDYSTFGICLYSTNATSYQLSHTRAYNNFEDGGTWSRAGDTTYYTNTPIDEAGIGFTNRKIFYGGSTGKINIQEDSPEFLDVKWSYHNHRLTIFFSWWFESSKSNGVGEHVEGAMTVITSAANPITGFSLNEGGNNQYRSWVKLTID